MSNQTPVHNRARAEVLLKYLAEQILQPYGKSDAAALAWEKFSADNQTRLVVVVGEVSRGKSALANALVGEKNLSPEGVNFTTAVSVGLGAGEPVGSARLFYSDRTEDIALDQLHEVINGTINQHRGVEKELPTRVFIPVQSSPLDAVVIDTPGVGGLDNSHAQLAQASAQQASVLVVACDASTPITAPEMDFIRTAGRYVDNVVVAVTKTDKHLSRFEDIVDDDRRILRKHLGREIEVFPVSSLLAVYDKPGLSQTDRQAIRNTSGIIELRQGIQARFDNAENIPAITGLKVAEASLIELREELETKLTTIQQAETALPELTTELERFQRLKKETESWEQYLQRDLTHSRQKAMDHLDTQLEEIKSKWTENISKHRIAVLRNSAQHFTSQIEADFQQGVVSSLAVFTEDLQHRIVEPLFHSEVVWEDIAAEIADAFTDKKLNPGEAKEKSEDLLDPMMLLMGFSGGSAIGSVLAGVLSFTGLGVVVGAGWVALNVGFRAMRAGKQSLLMWINQTVVAARTFTARLLEAAVANARPAIVLRYRTHLKESIEQAQRQVNAAKKAMEMEEKKRNASAARLNKNIEIVDKNIQRVQTMIVQLSKETAA
ncbi:TPA: dynamin family protein [Corynebacterium aurimucosum]|nr:dynamin family protein [Corynebacterium aurimucosum]